MARNVRSLILAGLALSPFFFVTGCLKKELPIVLSDPGEAPANLKAKRLQFTGTAHFSKVGVYSWRGGNSGPGKVPGQGGKEMWRHVVPITGIGWDKSKPVPLWITIASSRENVSNELAALKRALEGGEVVGKVIDFPSRTAGALRGVSAWQQAVAMAEAEHGLQSDPRAPIVIWEP